MSIIIDCAGKTVLHIKNATFDSLHKGIMAVIKEEKKQLSPNLKTMLEEMDQDIWGGGVVDVDIAEYLVTKEEALLFAYLVKRGIEKEHTVQYPFSKEALTCFWNFHQAILEYAKKLEKSKS